MPSSNDGASVVAICALILSIITVALNVWGQWTQRTHMRLSVRPIASIPVADFESRVAVWLANKGLGPMRVIKLTVVDADGTVHEDLLSHMPKLPRGIHWTNFQSQTDGAMVEAGKRLDLLVLEGDQNSPIFGEARDSVRRALDGLTVHLEYEDLYEKAMPPLTKSLTWFGRHWR